MLDIDPHILRSEYEAGATIKQLATKYGVSITPIRDRLQSASTPIRPRPRNSTLPEPGTPEYRRAWKRLHLANPINRMRTLIKSAQQRARERGLQFDEALFLIKPPKDCLSCEFELDYSTLQRSRYNRTPSLDRLDNSLGYTLANVRIICTRCNYLKNNATIDELRAVFRYMTSHAQR